MNEYGQELLPSDKTIVTVKNNDTEDNLEEAIKILTLFYCSLQ